MLNSKGLGLVFFLAIGVSVFGSFTMLIFALRPPLSQENIPWRKPLIGSAFTLICITGITATFLPGKCTESFQPRGKEKQSITIGKNSDLRKASIILKGHHPSCGRFSAHTILLGSQILCAACTGLLAGGIVTLIGTGLYFFVGWNFGRLDFWCVLVGQAGVFLGFVQLKLVGHVRLLANTLFVFGAFLTLVGIDRLVGSLFVDLYVVGLTIFWLWTRIIISQWDHHRICAGCQICFATEGKRGASQYLRRIL